MLWKSIYLVSFRLRRFFCENIELTHDKSKRIPLHDCRESLLYSFFVYYYATCTGGSLSFIHCLQRAPRATFKLFFVYTLLALL